MKRLALFIVFAWFASLAVAQVATVVSSSPTYDVGSVKGLSQNTDGSLRVSCPEPTATATYGITPVVSSAAEANHVLKATPGNLYGLSVTTGATAGYVLLFNATSAPADGAVTPLFCYAIPASSSIGVTFDIPAAFATGITASFSSTGCFTKTASATAFFAGSVK